MGIEQPKLALTDLRPWTPVQNSKALLIIFGLKYFLPLIAVLGPYVLKTISLLAPNIGPEICPSRLHETAIVDVIEGAVTYCILLLMQWPFHVLAVNVVQRPDAKYTNWAAGGALIGLVPPCLCLHLIFAYAPFDYACRFQTWHTGETMWILLMVAYGVLIPIVAFILGVLGWFIGRIVFAVTTCDLRALVVSLRASVVSLLENIIRYKFEIAGTLVAIFLAVSLSLPAPVKSRTFTGKDKNDLDWQLWKWVSDNPDIRLKKVLPLEKVKPWFGKIEARDTVSIRVYYED
jgi:hypothetical protein